LSWSLDYILIPVANASTGDVYATTPCWFDKITPLWTSYTQAAAHHALVTVPHPVFRSGRETVLPTGWGLSGTHSSGSSLPSLSSTSPTLHPLSCLAHKSNGQDPPHPPPPLLPLFSLLTHLSFFSLLSHLSLFSLLTHLPFFSLLSHLPPLLSPHPSLPSSPSSPISTLFSLLTHLYPLLPPHQSPILLPPHPSPTLLLPSPLSAWLAASILHLAVSVGCMVYAMLYRPGLTPHNWLTTAPRLIPTATITGITGGIWWAYSVVQSKHRTPYSVIHCCAVDMASVTHMKWTDRVRAEGSEFDNCRNVLTITPSLCLSRCLVIRVPTTYVLGGGGSTAHQYFHATVTDLGLLEGGIWSDGAQSAPQNFWGCHAHIRYKSHPLSRLSR